MSGESLEDPNKAKEAEARAAFWGYVDFMGPEVVEKAIRAAELNMSAGHRGVTIPSEDHSSMLVIDEAGVSFSVKDFDGYLVPLDTAKAVLWEFQQEHQQRASS